MGKKSDLESVHLVNHSKCILAAFQNFRQDETMLDVTIVCNGMRLKAHKLVLSACSPFFKEIFTENPCKHPVVVLRNFEFSDLKAIIDFIYKGELSVPRERLMSALKVAEELNIRGLSRSEQNKEKLEKIYNEFCAKQPLKKKRKRQHRRNSSDSGEKSCVNVSDTDSNAVQSDESLNANAACELQPMEVESVGEKENLANDKDMRPFVLRVGEPSTKIDEAVSKDVEDLECDAVSSAEKLTEHALPNENETFQEEEIEQETFQVESEDVASSSQYDSFAVCAESSNLMFLAADEQSSFQEQNVDLAPSNECSEEQVGFISSSSLSPKSLEAQKCEETKLPDEGKRFICSKCGSVFTSRINFMRHKATGHNSQKSLYECQHCNFTTEEEDCLKSHLLTHSDLVPYVCNICSEKFTSEELCNKHLSLHQVEETPFQSLSSTSGQDLFSVQNQNSENSEFRCSVCFIRFGSKIRCQIHEKTCKGGG